MSGASQLCPECGSPLRPCKCDRDEYASPPGAVANSTLGVRKGKRLKSKTRLTARSFSEKYADDVLRYGPLFELVREMRCFGLVYARDVPPHKCDVGYAPASAHHLDSKDHLDARGLLPVCGRMHDQVETFPKEIPLAEGWTIEKLGRLYVAKAARKLDRRRELPGELREALEAEDISW